MPSIYESVRTYLLTVSGITSITSYISPMALLEGPNGELSYVPSVVIRQIAVSRLGSLLGSSGVAKSRLQFQCWAKTAAVAWNLRQAVIDAVLWRPGTWGTTVVQDVSPVNQELDYKDPESKLWCCQIDMYVTYEL